MTSVPAAVDLEEVCRLVERGGQLSGESRFIVTTLAGRLVGIVTREDAESAAN